MPQSPKFAEFPMDVSKAENFLRRILRKSLLFQQEDQEFADFADGEVAGRRGRRLLRRGESGAYYADYSTGLLNRTRSRRCGGSV